MLHNAAQQGISIFAFVKIVFSLGIKVHVYLTELFGIIDRTSWRYKRIKVDIFVKHLYCDREKRNLNLKNESNIDAFLIQVDCTYYLPEVKNDVVVNVGGVTPPAPKIYSYVYSCVKLGFIFTQLFIKSNLSIKLVV